MRNLNAPRLRVPHRSPPEPGSTHVRSGVLALLGAVVLGGCATPQPTPRGTASLPASFVQPGADSPASWPTRTWYRGFSSEPLAAMIEAADSGNWDLAAARARVVQADARARQAGTALLPNLDAGANASFLAGHSASGSGHETDWSASLAASYEIDFWGRNHALAAAAGLLATAARAERDTLALTTSTGVATLYLRVLTIRERLVIASASLGTAREVLNVIESRHAAGRVSDTDVALQRTAVATTALAIPDLEQQEVEASAALAILLGRNPEGFVIPPMPLASITEPQLTPGLPAELLRRRPDVGMAEANLAAADANLAAARAALFPTFTLTTAAGVQNPALNAAVLTLPGTGPSLTLGASVLQTIFNRERLRAQRSESQAREQELLATYRGSIVAALGDVENALSAIARLDAAQPLQSEVLAQSERALDGARARYASGAGDFLTLLDAQRSLYAARDQAVQYRFARLQARLSLCKALGGGWLDAPADNATR